MLPATVFDWPMILKYVAIKEAAEIWCRRANDKKINQRTYLVMI
jgi:hypothetical protein